MEPIWVCGDESCTSVHESIIPWAAGRVGVNYMWV